MAQRSIDNLSLSTDLEGLEDRLAAFQTAPSQASETERTRDSSPEDKIWRSDISRRPNFILSGAVICRHAPGHQYSRLSAERRRHFDPPAWEARAKRGNQSTYSCIE
jgi:hypothetical protein